MIAVTRRTGARATSPGRPRRGAALVHIEAFRAGRVPARWRPADRPTAASTPPANTCPHADLRQDPASTGPRRPDQPLRSRGL